MSSFSFSFRFGSSSKPSSAATSVAVQRADKAGLQEAGVPHHTTTLALRLQRYYRPRAVYMSAYHLACEEVVVQDGTTVAEREKQ